MYPSSHSVEVLRSIVKNLLLKRCIERLLLLCSSNLSHHAFARAHTGTQALADMRTLVRRHTPCMNAASIRGRLLFPFAHRQVQHQFEGDY